MFDKILLPVDPSKRLKPAREYAIALSEKLQVPLVAAFIANPKKAGTGTASLDTRDGFAALGKRQLDQIIESNQSIMSTYNPRIAEMAEKRKSSRENNSIPKRHKWNFGY